LKKAAKTAKGYRPSKPPVEYGPVVVLKRDGFTLYYLAKKDGQGWKHLKLTRAGVNKKSNWTLAWNSERFSASSDYALLAKHYPELLAQITKIISARPWLLKSG
jgi:hypothetical protein